MATSSQDERRGSNPAASLTDDLIVEILSRAPVKSVCRASCVSKHWRALISHPDHRKRLPQTLAGFFFHTHNGDRFPESTRHFTNVSGRGALLIRPSLAFLPGHGDVTVLDSCGGMLLCRRRPTGGVCSYVVCNPATAEWAELPASGQGGGDIFKARLGFDPAARPHFHVFEFVETVLENDDVFVDGLEIYSSRTGEWARSDSGWSGDATLSRDFSAVFLNGFLHVFAYEHQDVLVVDTEGETWRTIAVPLGNDDGFIGQSQGRLYYLNTVEDHDFELAVYVLEDYATDEWIFKHRVSTSKLLRKSIFSPMQFYYLISVHPQCNRIFFVSDLDNTIRCYDMDRRKVHVICDMGCKRDSMKRCLSYVPLFLESLGG